MLKFVQTECVLLLGDIPVEDAPKSRLDYIVVITMTGAIMSHAPDYG
jgi:hypothetical protein